MPWAFAATAIIGAGVSAYGSISQGDAANDAAQYQAQVAANNSLIARRNAEYATQAGEREVNKSQFKTAGLIGSEKAAQAANGLDVNRGSAVDVRASTAELGMLDALTIRNNAARQAYGYETQAQGYDSQSALDRATGKNAQTAGYIGAASSILGSASSLATNFGGGGGGGGLDAGTPGSMTDAGGGVTNGAWFGGAPGDGMYVPKL